MYASWPYPPSILPTDALVQLSLDTAQTDGDAARIRLCGELDIASVGDLARWFELLHLGLRERLVVDLSAVTFCDAAGLHVLTTLHQSFRSHGRQLVLVNVSAAVRRIMRVTGDDRYLDLA